MAEKEPNKTEKKSECTAVSSGKRCFPGIFVLIVVRVIEAIIIIVIIIIIAVISSNIYSRLEQNNCNCSCQAFQEQIEAIEKKFIEQIKSQNYKIGALNSTVMDYHNTTRTDNKQLQEQIISLNISTRADIQELKEKTQINFTEVRENIATNSATISGQINITRELKNSCQLEGNCTATSSETRLYPTIMLLLFPFCFLTF